MHTGMKALGFNESAPLAGILSSPLRANQSLITNESDGTHAVRVTCSRVCLFGQSPSSTTERWKTKTIVKRR